MYSRKRGKAGSNKPSDPKTPSWVRYKNKEVEILVVKLAKEGKSSAEIGIILRDKYGIPSSKLITKKRIAALVKEKKLNKSLPDDLLALIKRGIALSKHLEANAHDETAKRGLRLTESKIGRLTSYYKGEGTLDEHWKYDRATARMLTE